MLDGLLGGWESQARGVSSDGSVVVGWAINGNGRKRAFLWTENDGMHDIGTLGGSTSEATGISADGATIVGWAYTADGFYRAFRWTCKQGMVQIKGSKLGMFRSIASAVSSDGTVIVGRGLVSGYWHAFVWTGGSGGMQNLGTLGGSDSQLLGCPPMVL